MTTYVHILFYVHEKNTNTLNYPITLESRINEQVAYQKVRKNPTYTHLFGTIRLLFFTKKSHLYVFSHLYVYYLLGRNDPPILLFFSQVLIHSHSRQSALLKCLRDNQVHKQSQDYQLQRNLIFQVQKKITQFIFTKKNKITDLLIEAYLQCKQLFRK